MCPARFLPIDLDRHFQRCVEFLCDAFVCSYGNSDAFDAIGGAQGYRAGLVRRVPFTYGAVTGSLASSKWGFSPPQGSAW
jgi:hypothetical protein